MVLRKSEAITPTRSTHRRRRRATRRTSRGSSSSQSKSSLLQRIGSLERNQETMRRVINRLNDEMKNNLHDQSYPF